MIGSRNQLFSVNGVPACGPNGRKWKRLPGAAGLIFKAESAEMKAGMCVSCCVKTGGREDQEPASDKVLTS